MAPLTLSFIYLDGYGGCHSLAALANYFCYLYLLVFFIAYSYFIVLPALNLGYLWLINILHIISSFLNNIDSR